MFSPQISITEPGFVYVYLSKDNVALGGSAVEVYFPARRSDNHFKNRSCHKRAGGDDFKVTHQKSHIIQSDDYLPVRQAGYSFGLTYNSYNRENSIGNMYQYNGKEMQAMRNEMTKRSGEIGNELDLGWLDYGVRM